MKFLTFIIICLLLVVGFFSFYTIEKQETYVLGNDFEIGKEQIDYFKEVAGEDFVICKMKTNECIAVNSLNG